MDQIDLQILELLKNNARISVRFYLLTKWGRA